MINRTPVNPGAFRRPTYNQLTKKTQRNSNHASLLPSYIFCATAGSQLSVFFERFV